jgi:hypothetical protein
MEISDADFGECLKDIRIWLDTNRFAPSSFTYFFLSPGMRLRVVFDIDGQATAFAARFGGILVDASDPCRPGAERKRDGQEFAEKAN